MVIALIDFEDFLESMCNFLSFLQLLRALLVVQLIFVSFLRISTCCTNHLLEVLQKSITFFDFIANLLMALHNLLLIFHLLITLLLHVLEKVVILIVEDHVLHLVRDSLLRCDFLMVVRVCNLAEAASAYTTSLFKNHTPNLLLLISLIVQRLVDKGFKVDGAVHKGCIIFNVEPGVLQQLAHL